MALTATTSFSEARRNLTAIADRVANEGVEYTVFKRSKPLFKIVPVISDGSDRGDVPADERPLPYGARPWTRAEAAARAAEREQKTHEQRATAEAACARAQKVGPRARHSRIPDGGEELFEFAMQLRARMPRDTELSRMTPQDVKRELANRDE